MNLWKVNSSWLRVGLLVALIHGCEDVILLSMGRFLPVPLWALYVIGVALSTLVLTVLIDKISRRVKSSGGDASPHFN